MNAIHKNSIKAAVALALSIAALPNLVNGQPQSLSTVNTDKSSNQVLLKDSVKDAKSDIAKLIAAVLKKGTNENTRSSLSPVIGLPKAMPAMDVEVPISQKASVTETRRCFVVYENVEGTASEKGDKRPVCAYIVRAKRAGLDKETKYFRINLNGNLEKVVLTQGKYDASGKIVRGSGVKFDLDINSPEVKETFEAEMKFWLKDWLRKEQKNAAKKTVGTAKTNASAAAL